jgi:copper transport protein
VCCFRSFPPPPPPPPPPHLDGRRRLKRLAALAAAAVVGLLVVLLPATPASAHATLLKTDPERGSILNEAPSAVTLTFSEAVGTRLGRLTVVDPDGKRATEGKMTQGKPTEATVALKKDLRQGTYLVSYRVISADGHPISGGYTFSIGAPSQQATKIDDSTEAEVDPLVRGILSVSKFTGYLGVALLGGAVLMLAALWPRRLDVAGPAKLVWIGWGLLFGGTLASLLVQAPYSTGGTLADITWDDLTATASTVVGKAQVIRLGLLVAATTLLWRVTKAKPLGTAEWGLLTAFGTLTLFTWPFAGHAWASPGRLLSIPADAIHVGAMAVWIGGLVVLARYLLPAAKADELAVILPVWSRWATYAVIALAFTGTIESLLEIGTFGALLTSTYGRLVIAKIVGLAAILSVAALARAWVRQRYPVTVAHALSEEEPPPDEEGPKRLRSRIFVEVALAVVVIGVATALVQTTPGRTAVSAAAPQQLAFNTTVDTPKLKLQIDLSPAQRGNNSMHLTAFTKDGKPIRVIEWKATIALKEKGIESVEIPLLAITENHVVGEVQIPVAGDWELKATVRTSDVDQVTVDRKIRVR